LIENLVIYHFVLYIFVVYYKKFKSFTIYEIFSKIQSKDSLIIITSGGTTALLYSRNIKIHYLYTKLYLSNKNNPCYPVPIAHHKLVSFLPHEKFIIASVFEETPKARKYFNFFSPKTILNAWKNAVSKHWSFPHKKQGKPPVSTAIKKLVLKLKKENPLWGARRIRDERKKLYISISHETVCKIINRFRKTGDIQPVFSQLPPILQFNFYAINFRNLKINILIPFLFTIIQENCVGFLTTGIILMM